MVSAPRALRVATRSYPSGLPAIWARQRSLNPAQYSGSLRPGPRDNDFFMLTT